MDFVNYIKPELLVLIPVLYLIGIAVKKSEIKDKLIPVILGGIGIALSCIYVFATTDIDGVKTVFTAIFTAVTQGVLCAGATVYADQLIKQANKKE